MTDQSAMKDLELEKQKFSISICSAKLFGGKCCIGLNYLAGISSINYLFVSIVYSSPSHACYERDKNNEQIKQFGTIWQN